MSKIQWLHVNTEISIQRRSVVKSSVGVFSGVCLFVGVFVCGFVCLFVNTITSEPVNIHRVSEKNIHSYCWL